MKTRRMGSGILAIVLSAALVGSGCNTNWINTAINDIPVVLQIVTSILSIVAIAEGRGQTDPAMIAEVKNIAVQATNDLTTAQKLINDYKTASAADKPNVLGKIDAALNAAQKDLQGILTAFHVKDTATQTAISAGIGLAVTTVEAIISLLPPAPSTGMPTAMTAKKAPPHKPDKPEDLKAKYNAIVSANFPDAVI
jgi:hypothetical protein